VGTGQAAEFQAGLAAAGLGELPAEWAAELVAAMDSNGDGGLDLKEFQRQFRRVRGTRRVASALATGLRQTIKDLSCTPKAAPLPPAPPRVPPAWAAAQRG
jgi:hypothetical protein